MTTANERKILDTAHAAASTEAQRGRKSGPAAQPVATTALPAAVAQDIQALDALAATQTAYGQERDLLNQLLGQAQMASAIAKFSETVSTSKLAYVKENKLYRALKGQKSGNGFDFLTGTWEEFCGLLGVTSRKVDEDIANLQSFGEEALETMSRMGIGYRELRQYRRLPEDQKQALIEVAKAGDKEGFVELAEEIIARHAKEKEALTQTLAAKDRVLTDNATKINELDEKLKQEQHPLAASAARQAVLWQDISTTCAQAYKGLNATVTAVGLTLDEDSDAPQALQQHARNALTFLAQQLADMAHQWRVQIDLAERIEAPWSQAFDPAELAALAERNNAAGVWQGR